MTIYEAIKSNTVVGQMPDDRIVLSSNIRGIDTSGTANESSLKDVELITADLYMELLYSPDFSEGKLSIKYDRKMIESYILSIAEKYDDEMLLERLPKIGSINDITDIW